METNRAYFDAIKPILDKLREKVEGDFVLFGSSTLYLLGIEKFEGLDKIHDLDITLDGKVKEGTETKIVHFEHDPNKKLYKVNINGINIDIGTLWVGHERWLRKIFADPIIINGYKFANLQTVLDYKKMNVSKYDREKDRVAIAKIEEYLKTTGGSRGF